jgi:hypothetical protein
MTLLEYLKSFFGPSQKEIEEAKKIEILEQLYKDIKRLRAEGDFYGKYPGCRYAYDSFTGTWVNQGLDGITGPDWIKGARGYKDEIK